MHLCQLNEMLHVCHIEVNCVVSRGLISTAAVLNDTAAVIVRREQAENRDTQTSDGSLPETGGASRSIVYRYS